MRLTYCYKKIKKKTQNADDMERKKGKSEFISNKYDNFSVGYRE